MAMRLGPDGGSTCMVCDADLWHVGRYVSAGAVVLCDGCVTKLKQALDASEGEGRVEFISPPRVHGSAPDAEAPIAVAEAFVRTFGSAYDDLGDYLEDADELGPSLADGAARFGPGVQFSARLYGIRFAKNDFAEVRFQVCMNGAPTGMQYQGSARKGADGRWRVTRETVGRVLPGGGGRPPPRGL